ncbi:unnamed protein product, partial [Schistosoma rodhaini]|uniref:Uncharacterized protein n=1 Tax=Schistosoma rodhaini TaxID=6188 RepID=A0AA85GLH7_9TREM
VNSYQIRIEPNQQVTSIDFYNKASAIALLQLLIIWVMHFPLLLSHPLKEWLRTANWFVGLCFFLGLFIDLDMGLLPQLQFKFRWNYIILVFNVFLIISGFRMLLTIIYELAIATQAIFPGDKRFSFRDDQYFLFGLVLATIMIWMNMIISSEISLICSVFNKTCN